MGAFERDGTDEVFLQCSLYLFCVSVRGLFWVDFKFCLSSDDADLGRIQWELFLKKSPKWQIYQTLTVLDECTYRK